jgi:hypothetical protein
MNRTEHGDLGGELGYTTDLTYRTLFNRAIEPARYLRVFFCVR